MLRFYSSLRNFCIALCEAPILVNLSNLTVGGGYNIALEYIELFQSESIGRDVLFLFTDRNIINLN